MSSNTDLTASIAEELSLFVRSQSVTFTCGGTIPIGEATVNDISKGALTCAPVDLRWDTTDGVDKITFPVKDAAGEAKLAKMCGTCQPATFGLKGENVLDETYRKATKLDRSAFSSDFCPHELGIIDTIAQMLLPNAVGKHRGSGVHAELYKLNVYGSPSGFFKSHVDTPRSDTQFGSLVISLPCHHEGGQLVVRHAGHEAVFDWSTSKVKQDAICWAAFYSDCEHEVKEITEGNRVTLTYNLFSVPGVGDLAETCPAMDVATIPFYHKVKEALLNPDFMTQGGHLGIPCSHAYAHHSQVGSISLPAVLKGSDMAVYAVFKAQGLNISVRATTFEDDSEDEDSEMYDSEENDTDDDDSTKDEDNQKKDKGPPRLARFGDLGSVYVENFYDESNREIMEAWTQDKFNVTWLSVPADAFRELGAVFGTYGNEPSTTEMYTHAVMLVEIPSAEKRLGMKK